MLQKLKRLLETLWGLIVYINPINSEDAAIWWKQDRGRLQDAPGIDVRGLGRLIGVGLQHRIYEYEQENRRSVLKLTTPVPLLRFPTSEQARQDIALVSRYFSPYAVEPTEVIPLRDRSYAILQRRLNTFRPVTPADLGNNARLRTQFLDLVRRNLEMMQTVARSLDFLGREGQRKSRAALLGLNRTPCLSNVVIETQPDGSEQLKIVDTDLENFYPDATDVRDVLSALAARLAVALNRLLIRRFFGIDIAHPKYQNEGSGSNSMRRP